LIFFLSSRDNLKIFIFKAEIPEGAYKILSKLISNMYPIYTNKESKLNLIRLIDYLVKISYDQSVKNIVQGLEDTSKIYISAYPK
jgi:hypothetical protein